MMWQFSEEILPFPKRVERVGPLALCVIFRRIAGSK